MATPRPRGDRTAADRPAAQRRTASGNLFVPRGSREAAGKEVDVRCCGQTIEAKPTLGQIGPFEAAWGRLRPEHEETWQSSEYLDKRGDSSGGRNDLAGRVSGGKMAEQMDRSTLS